MKGDADKGVVTDQGQAARWLGFLIEAQRWSGVTQTKVATQASVRSCNLSAFIASGGKVRNVGPSRLPRLLNEVGVHPNGMLTAGLHRWDVTVGPEDRYETFQELVDLNPSANPEHAGRFFIVDEVLAIFLHRPTNLTTVMARLPAELAGSIAHRRPGLKMRRLLANEASELLSLWLTEHPWVINRGIDQYLELEPAVLAAVNS